MAVVRIHERQTFENIKEFKSTVSAYEKNQAKKRRFYKVLINKKTGAIRFEKERQDKQDLEDQDIQTLYLYVHNPETVVSEPAFKVVSENSHSFDLNSLNKKAEIVVRETLYVLNVKSKEFHNEKERVEDFVLENLDEFSLSMDQEEVLKTLAYKGAVTRSQAEDLLEEKEVGSYLIRDLDHLEDSVRHCFNVENCINCRGYIITVKSQHDKICEYLVYNNGGWEVYNDDLDYQQQFSTFSELIKTIPSATLPLK